MGNCSISVEIWQKDSLGEDVKGPLFDFGLLSHLRVELIGVVDAVVREDVQLFVLGSFDPSDLGSRQRHYLQTEGNEEHTIE